MNWKEIAPSRDDWMRLTREWKAAGLPHIPWINGIPQFPEGTDMERVHAIATGPASQKAAMATPKPKTKAAPKAKAVPAPKAKPKKGGK